jgi:hypothetical protein
MRSNVASSLLVSFGVRAIGLLLQCGEGLEE